MSFKRELQSCVGVDVGGTWLRVALCRPPYRRILRTRRRITKAPLPKLLPRILRSWRLGRVDRLTIGAHGVWDNSSKRRLKLRLTPFARQVQVLSDLELAWRAGFKGNPGILIVCGTGSAAYGQDSCGHTARSGGLGPLLGDEGSAFWIGKQWLSGRENLALNLAHRSDTVRATASLAREVLREAAKNPQARRILHAAWKALADLVAGVSRQLHFKGKISVCWSGGMFQDRNFTSGFLRSLRRRSPRFQPVVAVRDVDIFAAGGMR